MTEIGPAPGRGRIAVLKVVYLLAVTAITFAVPSVTATRPVRWYVVPALFFLQVAILLRCGQSPGALVRSASRLKWLFTVLLICYTFLPADDRRAAGSRRVSLPLGAWVIGVNVDGASQAALMCVQIVTIILASAVVRLTGSGTDLLDGLRTLRLPTLFIHSLDHTLGQLGGLQRRGSGRGNGCGDGSGGRGRAEDGPSGPPASSPGFFAILQRMIRGDLFFFTQAIRGSLERAREQVQRESHGQLDERLAHDVAIVTGIALVMGSLKIVETMPGVPFAPGHKTLLLYPLYVLASRLARSRWGGTAAGAVMGAIGFLQGNGRFGVLDVLRHLAPGFVIDLLMPFVERLPPSFVVYCGLGLVAAVARTATEFAVVVLLGARAEVYLFPAARLVPNLVAGILSGFITVYVVRAFPRGELATEPLGEQENSKPQSEQRSQPDLVAVQPDGGGHPPDRSEEGS